MTLDERILAYLDGSSTPAEIAALEEVLETDRSARDRFARLSEQDTVLRQILSCEGAAPRTRSCRSSVAVHSQTPWAAIAIAAAALLFALVLAAALSGDGGTRTPRVARPRPVPVTTVEPPPRPAPVPSGVDGPPLRREPPPPPPPPKKVEPRVEAPAPKPPSPPVRPEAPAPEPKPEPAPRPEPPATPKVTEAAVIVARLERLRGQVEVESTPATEGYGLPAGKGLRTIGPESSVLVRFPDSTLVELGGDTRVAQITNGAGKKILLDLGAATAQVTRQTPGQPLLFVTPHAEARVLGTKLTLTVSEAETRLEVREGRVKLARRSDQASVEVAAGQFAVASDAVRPAAKKLPSANLRVLFAEDFDDEARWQRIEGGFPTTVKGTLEIDVSPKPSEPYAGATWHIPGGLRTKPSFAAPFRVSVDVEISHKDQAINTLLVLIPMAPGPRTGKSEVAVRLRAAEYSVIVETKHVAQAEHAGAAPVRERWTVEFGLKEVALSVNGKPVLRHAHGLTLAPEYFVELQGAAKLEAPPGARVRFDNFKIEP